MEELVAKGFITITNVDDGYTVSLSTPSVSITADHDGSNPDLSHADTLVMMSKGSTPLNFNITSIFPQPREVQFDARMINSQKWVVRILSIPPGTTSGYLQIALKAEDGYETFVRFSFSVAKDLQGIKWIEEWNGTLTEIGKDYVVTPKIFAGKKEAGSITGIYLGKKSSIPAEDYPFDQASEYYGIYGIDNNKISFCIDRNGGYIGGWYITNNALYNGTLTDTIGAHTSSSGDITIGSQGIRGYKWRLDADGGGDIAGGKIAWKADGSVELSSDVTITWGNNNGKLGNVLKYNELTGEMYYDGPLTAEQMNAANCNFTQGHIGGIEIKPTYIAAFDVPDAKGIRQPVWQLNSDGSGGLAKYKIKWDALGNIALSPDIKIFWGDNREDTIGSIFAYDPRKKAIVYTGTLSAAQMNAAECNFTKGHIGGITIFKNSLTAIHHYEENGVKIDLAVWQLMNDGSGYLACQNIKWDNMGNITLSPDIKISWGEGKDSRFGDSFTYKDGVLKFTGALDAAQMDAAECNFTRGHIGGMNISEYSIFSQYCVERPGSPVAACRIGWVLYNDGSASFAGGNMQLEGDGSGSICNGAISWTKEGAITFSSDVSLSWDNVSGAIGNKLTYIDKNGIYTGTLTAEQINALSCKFYQGTIGGFEIHSDYIGATKKADGSFSGLSIYNDRFSVGDQDMHIMMGRGSSGSINQRTVSAMNIHFSQKNSTSQNVGINVDVTGGKSNYALKSEAAVNAGACIGTRVTYLDLAVSKRVDFSTSNIFIISNNSDKVNSLGLPSASDMAQMFSAKQMVDGFGFEFTVIGNPISSQPFIIGNLYNANGELLSLRMASFDSIRVLALYQLGTIKYYLLNTYN